MTRQRGFTLLELLVGIVVLGLILAGIAGGVGFGQRAAATQERLIAAHADASAVERVLRRLVAGMEPGPKSGPPRLEGHATAMAFAADLGQLAAGAGLSQVGLGVDAGHRLVMRTSPVVNAIRLGAAAPPTTTVLLDGVARVEFAFWDGSAWLGDWTGAELPAMVRIRLHFLPESRRAWPDMLVATARQRPQG